MARGLAAVGGGPAQPRARMSDVDKSRRRASAQGMAISRSDELGLVDGDGINVGEQVRRRSRVRVLALPLPMVRSCKRVDVDVGRCHQKEMGDLPDQVGLAVGLACCARLCLPDAGGVKPQVRGSRS